MALTLGTTGMDRAIEAEVAAAFKIANAETGKRWTFVEGDAADYVIIDMDSLYGPMSWMRLHSAGRKVIALTSTDRQQTDYRLPRPLNATDLAVLLSEIAGDAPAEPPAPAAAPAPLEPLEPLEAIQATVASQPAAEAAAEPAPEPTPAAEPTPEPEPEPALAPPPTADAIESVAAAPAPPATRTLQRWLATGALRQRVRLQCGDAPALLIDPAAGHWHGPATLKPLAPCFAGELLESDFATPDAADWDAEAAALGPAQPLQRLQWLGGLLSGAATEGQYLLKKWPQTEREYPKHFRIATVMMKGPAGVAEIAEASGVSAQEVVDFINANLATGYAEPAVEPPPSAPASPRTTGLFGRIRGH